MQAKNNNMERCRLIALQLIILMGIVSLCGSLVSNGARSVTGPFLLFLGGTAAIVGLVAGLGEFIGHSLRLVTGVYLTKRGHYWAIVMIGYGLLIAIPLLAFAGRWEVAALLLITERVGKAIRAPARDTILSHAASNVGLGWGFGLHKLLDQIGAIIGPIVLAIALTVRGDYSSGFLLLAIPLIFMTITLLAAETFVPRPGRLETEEETDLSGTDHLGDVFVPYAIFIFLSMAGFANYPLISYHIAVQSLIPDTQIPLVFTIAMLMSGPVALLAGREYDRYGTVMMAIFPVLNIIVPFFVFSFALPGILAGAVLWGAALGMQETILRATIADFTAKKERGMAYGIMNAVFGTAWFLGSVVMGVLYDVSITHIITFIVIVELLSLPAFVWLRRSAGQRTA
jgi:MFS-type transporter involved in bile tolerance (Atg22 family)